MLNSPNLSVLPSYPISRPSRLRQSQTLRSLVSETKLTLDDLVYPIFIKANSNKTPIKSMPGQFQLSLEGLAQEVKEVKALGLKSLMLFGVPEKNKKDNFGSENLCEHSSLIPKAIKLIKNIWPECFVISDMCLCDYSDHGHCFVLGDGQKFDQNQTLAYLQKAAVVHAKAGSDMIAPSGMVDGMIKSIRHALDENVFNIMPIMSYSNKFASSYYGPFRDAAESPPQFGDRKSYQMDYANISESLREASLDVSEGADLLMVKPAGSYLDIVKLLKDTYPLPIAAYQVSGEYSMIHAAAERGWIDLEKTALESLTCIKRAGANLIMTYFAKDVAKWIS